jgi:hypothetical protein
MEIVDTETDNVQLSVAFEAMTKKHTPASYYIDSLIEPLLVLSSKFAETEQEQIPKYFWPVTGKYGIRGRPNWTSLALHGADAF